MFILIRGDVPNQNVGTFLVRAALGLVPLRSGDVVFCGATLSNSLKSRSADVRRDLQLVFQDPVASLNPQMKVRAIIEEQLLVHERAMPKEAKLELVKATLRKVGLDDAYLERYPHQLSGGQAQRVAIARALVLRPKVLVCDEATSSVDTHTDALVQRIIRSEFSASTVLTIAHRLDTIMDSDRILVLGDGSVLEFGPPQQLLAKPDSALSVLAKIGPTDGE